MKYFFCFLKFALLQLVLFFFISITGLTSAQELIPSYKNLSLPVDSRIDDLLTRLTIEEKISLLGGTGFATKPIQRLGIPEIKMTDGPIGVRWEKSTCMPASIAMAASWDTSLISKIAGVFAIETKAHGRNMLLGPCININRVPHGGRNFESFGEDPYLTARMAVSYVKALQSHNVITSTKHYALNNQEWQRESINVTVDERALREIYLPAFEAAVKEADTWTIMASYNKAFGYHLSENDYMLNSILKNEWGFKGLVVSDWGATHSTVNAAKFGLDLEMPKGDFFNNKLIEALNNKEITIAQIDDKVRRILRVAFWAGLFDKDNAEDKGALDTKEHRALALKAAEEGIVLLKNNSAILPLDFSKVKSIALLGPNAAVNRHGGGGSSQVEPFYSVSILDAFKSSIGNKVKINYAQGCKSVGDINIIPTEFLFTELDGKRINGLKGEYFNSMDFEGNPALTRVDKVIDFDWGDKSPAIEIKNDKFSVRWTGVLVPGKTGRYELSTMSDDGSRLYIDGKLLVDNWGDHAALLKSSVMELTAGKEYSVKIEYYENGGGANMKLGWEENNDRILIPALEAAKNSDAVIICAGLSSHYESEGFDRKELTLPADQVELIQKAADVNKNVVVVLYSGAPVLMNEWIDKVSGLVEVWFPGQEGGNAIANILTGKINPSGKLPVTFPAKWEESPAYGNYPGDKEINYAEGTLVGYRHFDAKKIKPLFPFGFGLSYTSFQYSDLKIVVDASGEKANVSFKITNIGKTEGAEAAQLYLKNIAGNIKPYKELKGFCKVFLKPNESKELSFTIDRRAMSYYDVNKKDWQTLTGEFEVLAGSSSEDIRLKVKYSINKK